MTEEFFAAVVASFFTVELAFLAFQRLKWRTRIENLSNLARDFIAASDDDQRQHAILKLSFSLFLFSISFSSVLALIGLPVALPIFFLDDPQKNATSYLLYLSIVALAYGGLRLWQKKKAQKNKAKQEKTDRSATALTGPLNERHYNLLESILHWVALEPHYLRRLLFAIEQRSYARKFRAIQVSRQGKDHGPVYVCGLARSGTTLVLNLLHETGVFASLLYKDMPFVMSPNLWGFVHRSSKSSVQVKERAHGDNVLISTEHPEAFEEVFWEAFRQTASPEGCFDYTPTEGSLELFQRYQAGVIHRRQTETKQSNLRYLSKNNNNLLRLRHLSKNTSASILLVYRDPISVAQSLHRQHTKFSSAQTTDPFIRKYMNWLAHHEFGLDHAPFCFAKVEGDFSDPDNRNYWLAYWINIHRHIMSQLSEIKQSNIVLVHYNDLCEAPENYVVAIAKTLRLTSLFEPSISQFTAPSAKEDDAFGFNQELLREANGLYQQLAIHPSNLIPH